MVVYVYESMVVYVYERMVVYVYESMVVCVYESMVVYVYESMVVYVYESMVYIVYVYASLSRHSPYCVQHCGSGGVVVWPAPSPTAWPPNDHSFNNSH